MVGGEGMEALRSRAGSCNQLWIVTLEFLKFFVAEILFFRFT